MASRLQSVGALRVVLALPVGSLRRQRRDRFAAFLNERVVIGMTVNQPAPVPTTPAHHNPFTTSSVQIDEVASSYNEGSVCGSVCSDFVHVAAEPTSHWPETSSTASSSSYTILEPAPAEAISVEPATSMEPAPAPAEATPVEPAPEDWELID